MIDAYIGIGSNLGDRLENVAAAVSALAELPGSRLAAVSRVYESEPWGVEGQQTFYNAVAKIITTLYADQLLGWLKDTETNLGRKATTRFGPRTIDLDILLFGDEEWSSADLTIPHPRMAERAFVITPLLEIAPEVAYPDGVLVDAEADSARQGRILGIVGEVPGFEDLTPSPPAEERTGPPPCARADLTGADIAAMDRGAGARKSFVTSGGQQWVALGLGRMVPSGGVADLMFFKAVLDDAGIPAEFYPYDPGEFVLGPYGLPREIDIYVPASREREASELIREAREAPNAEPGPSDA